MSVKIKLILTVKEAVQVQAEEYGCVVFSRDALYGAIHAGRLAVIRQGQRRLYIPRQALQTLLEGKFEEQEN